MLCCTALLPSPLLTAVPLNRRARYEEVRTSSSRCLERREAAAFDCLQAHVRTCSRCTAADQRGQLLAAGALCSAGARLLAAWDAAEDAIATAIVPMAMPA